MESMEWSLPAVYDVVAAAAPDRDMLVWKQTRRTYAEVATRTRSFAAFLQRHGIGVRRERDELERWECGQAPVALLLYNCPEYIEAMLGCFRARAVPFNVNQHYRPEEVRSLLDMVGAEAVVYHRSLGPLVAEAARGRAASLLVDVDDGSGVAAARRQHELRGRRRPARPTPRSSRCPSPDDLYLVCTGGTTGSPKGVLWRQGDIFVAAMGGSRRRIAARALTARAAAGGGTWFAAPPLMHAAAQWTAFAAIHSGATIVLHDDAAPFDARTILETVARERVNFMSIVGDAFARRLIEELRRTTLRPRVAAHARDGRRRDERRLQGGAARAAPARHHRRRLRRVGDRRHGLRRVAARGRARTASRRADGAAVLSADRQPLPRAGRRRDRLDRAARPRAARLPRRPEEDRGDLPDHRRPARRRPRRSGAARAGRRASCCSGATRWS